MGGFGGRESGRPLEAIGNCEGSSSFITHRFIHQQRRPLCFGERQGLHPAARRGASPPEGAPVRVRCKAPGRSPVHAHMWSRNARVEGSRSRYQLLHTLTTWKMGGSPYGSCTGLPRVYGCSLSGVGSSSSLKAAGAASNIILLCTWSAGRLHTLPTGGSLMIPAAFISDIRSSRHISQDDHLLLLTCRCHLEFSWRSRKIKEKPLFK